VAPVGQDDGDVVPAPGQQAQDVDARGLLGDEGELHRADAARRPLRRTAAAHPAPTTLPMSRAKSEASAIFLPA
jgi:hypothetical protein